MKMFYVTEFTNLHAVLKVINDNLCKLWVVGHKNAGVYDIKEKSEIFYTDNFSKTLDGILIQSYDIGYDNIAIECIRLLSTHGKTFVDLVYIEEIINASWWFLLDASFADKEFPDYKTDVDFLISTEKKIIYELATSDIFKECFAAKLARLKIAFQNTLNSDNGSSNTLNEAGLLFYARNVLDAIRLGKLLTLCGFLNSNIYFHFTNENFTQLDSCREKMEDTCRQLFHSSKITCIDNSLYITNDFNDNYSSDSYVEMSSQKNLYSAVQDLRINNDMHSNKNSNKKTIFKNNSFANHNLIQYEEKEFDSISDSVNVLLYELSISSNKNDFVKIPSVICNEEYIQKFFDIAWKSEYMNKTYEFQNNDQDYVQESNDKIQNDDHETKQMTEMKSIFNSTTLFAEHMRLIYKMISAPSLTILLSMICASWKTFYYLALPPQLWIKVDALFSKLLNSNGNSNDVCIIAISNLSVELSLFQPLKHQFDIIFNKWSECNGKLIDGKIALSSLINLVEYLIHNRLFFIEDIIEAQSMSAIYEKQEEKNTTDLQQEDKKTLHEKTNLHCSMSNIIDSNKLLNYIKQIYLFYSHTQSVQLFETEIFLEYIFDSLRYVFHSSESDILHKRKTNNIEDCVEIENHMIFLGFDELEYASSYSLGSYSNHDVSLIEQNLLREIVRSSQFCTLKSIMSDSTLTTFILPKTTNNCISQNEKRHSFLRYLDYIKKDFKDNSDLLTNDINFEDHSLNESIDLSIDIKKLDHMSVICSTSANPSVIDRPKSFSPTSLLLLIDQPFHYYVRYILDLKKGDFFDEYMKFFMEDVDYTVFGNIIHNLAESILRSVLEKETESATIIRATDFLLKRDNYDAMDFYFAQKAVSSIAEFLRELHMDGWELKAEQKISLLLPIPNSSIEVNISARADLIATRGKEVKIFDYKTSSSGTFSLINEFRGQNAQMSLQGLILTKNAELEGKMVEFENMSYVFIDQQNGTLTEKNILQTKSNKEILNFISHKLQYKVEKCSTKELAKLLIQHSFEQIDEICYAYFTDCLDLEEKRFPLDYIFVKKTYGVYNKTFDSQVFSIWHGSGLY